MEGPRLGRPGSLSVVAQRMTNDFSHPCQRFTIELVASFTRFSFRIGLLSALLIESYPWVTH